MTLQAWDTCIWGVSPILLCGYSQALSGYFQRWSNQVKVLALAGPLEDIQRLGTKPLLRCLRCVFSVVVLLESEHSPQSEVLSALEQIFIKDLYILCSVHLSLNPD